MTETQPETNENNSQKRRKAIIMLTAFFLVIGFIWLLYWLVWGRFHEYTDDAYVGGNIVAVMAQVPGTVIEITTDDTQLVTQGQPIVKLDPTDTTIALQRAEATLAETVREVRQYFENAERAQATLILRSADLMKAQLDLKRRVGLVGERAISREEMQHYTTAAQGAEAEYKAALHTLRAAVALVENSHIYTHPLVERAKANLKSAYLNKQRTVIVAPVTGYVAKRSVQVGQEISMKTTLLAIVPLNEIWVDANYKESQLSRIRINQPVNLYADANSDVTYHGKVLGLSPGTGVTFSLLPPQNATGNWIKIVQRLPVRIGFDPEEIKKNPLLIGLSMHVTINTYHLDGKRLATTSKTKTLYATPVYQHQLAEVDTLIAVILKANAADQFFPAAQLTGQA